VRSGALGDTLRVGATFAGTVIGAGFASGQEIVQFFVSFGKEGLAGILVSALLLAWLGGRLLELGYRLRAAAYHQVVYYVCGRRAGFVIDTVTAVFLFAALAVMLAGAATVSRDYFSLPYGPALAVAGSATVLTVWGGIRSVAFANMMLTPVLVVCILAIGLYSLVYHAFDPFLLTAPAAPAKQPAPHWLLASLLYTSYNLAIGSTVLVPLGASVPLYVSRWGGGVLGGLILGGLTVFLSLVVMVHYPHYLSQEMPFLAVASQQHPLTSTIYAFVLLAAMFTTALASLYGCAGKIAAAIGIRPGLAALVAATAALAGGQFGFANLIRLLFPVFGYVALLFIVRLAWLSLRDSRWR